ncbi:hypothetical protein Marpi_1538 [Marinitoga piezophila KA3]|uniref:Uncharacterized protein n=1 Tax=Marinitoga piezophila (strain DSM 14283 / JCM 11233 / KA3) TaxID=443254 RepID=H2J4J0_MARPK|nr:MULTISPECIES: hypothetical protein [Marinitoga]AEX85932.1 hypothetical protein Marpi_1538 [Marinitoga piezophila KA3]
MDFNFTSFINILNLLFSIVILVAIIKLSYIVMKLPLKNENNKRNDKK